MQIVYTLSKNTFSIFLTWTDLGSTKHQTKAEIEDACNVCKAAVAKFRSNIASLDVDNVARGMAGKVAAKFAAEGEVVLVIRDPSHCIDLCSKDIARTKCVSRVIAKATEVKNFVKMDCIDSICTEAIEVGEIKDTMTAVSMIDSCM